MLAEPYLIQPNGTISVPNRPGLGFQLNQALVDACTVEMWQSD